MALIDKDRLLRLQRAARAGNIVHSKHGVFELNPCSECGFHHKLSLSLKKQAPCPATDVGRRYYGRHPKEKLKVENFPLNKVLKTTIQTLPSHEKPIIQALPIREKSQKSLSSKSLPKVVKSEDAVNQNDEVFVHLQPNHSFTVQPATTRVKRKNKAASSVGTPLNNSFIDNLTWNDVFLESQLSSSTVSSDADSKENQDADTMRRQLLREMFSQEEEALRLRLAKDKDNYILSMK